MDLATATLALWLAGSVQSPEIIADPFDYEVSAGWDYRSDSGWLKSKSRFLYERESGHAIGQYFHGRIWDLDLKYFLVEEYVKTAKDIDTQLFVAKYPWELGPFVVEIGAGTRTEGWRDESFAPYFKVYNKYTSVSIVGTDRKSNKFSHAKGSAQYKHKFKRLVDKKYEFSGFYIKPLFIIYYSEEREDYQGKLEIGYDFFHSKKKAPPKTKNNTPATPTIRRTVNG